jgi:hypothetical protein
MDLLTVPKNLATRNTAHSLNSISEIKNSKQAPLKGFFSPNAFKSLERENNTSIQVNSVCKSELKASCSVLTGLSQPDDEDANNNLELYKEEYDPNLNSKKPHLSSQLLPPKILQPQGSGEISDIEDMFVRTGERKDEVKIISRSLQFFFLINPLSGSGKGQEILEKNPKPFSFTTNFWKDLQGCAEIKQINVGFFSTNRPEKMAKFYSQLAELSNIDSEGHIDQHIVLCGGDGSLGHLI